jgi:hypothetical protein
MNRDFSLKDTIDVATYIGFKKFVVNNFSFSMDEFFSSKFSENFLRKAKN